MNFTVNVFLFKGDWLKMINGEIITANTIKDILSKINPPTTVRILKNNAKLFDQYTFILG